MAYFQNIATAHAQRYDPCRYVEIPLQMASALSVVCKPIKKENCTRRSLIYYYNNYALINFC